MLFYISFYFFVLLSSFNVSDRFMSLPTGCQIFFLHSKKTQMYSTALHSFCMTIMRFLMLLLLHIILYPVDICVYKPNCMHVTTQRKRIPLLLLYFLSYGNYFYLLLFFSHSHSFVILQAFAY